MCVLALEKKKGENAIISPQPFGFRMQTIVDISIGLIDVKLLVEHVGEG